MRETDYPGRLVFPLTLKGAQEELAKLCLQMAKGETKYLKLVNLGPKGLLLFVTWERKEAQG